MLVKAVNSIEIFEDLATTRCDHLQGFRYSDFHPPFEEEEETNAPVVAVAVALEDGESGKRNSENSGSGPDYSGSWKCHNYNIDDKGDGNDLDYS